MNNCIRIITLLLSSILIFSSCSSVYVDPDESTEKTPEIDTEEEYFTDGSPYNNGNSYDGFYYEGCWIYVEKQRTMGPRGLLTRDGKEYVRYGEVEMQRIVKFNPTTGVTSSPCLDPVCNHSFESGCLMLVQNKAGKKEPTITIQKIIGDWMIFFTRQQDTEYVSLITTTVYNLKTGESRSMCEEDLSSAVMTCWDGGSAFEDKYYNVKQILDYTETGYKQGGEGENVLDYSPNTKQIVCEHDLKTGKVKELFEIPSNYYLSAVSSQRFFFWDDENTMHCCKRDGSEMRKEEHLTFRPENLAGTRAYLFTESEYGVSYLDIKTNEKKSILVDFREYKRCALAENGILFDHLSTYDNYLELINSKEQFIEEHTKNMSEYEAGTLFSEELNKLFYGGTSRIYITDFDGSNMRLLYEEENAAIMSTYAQGDFLFVIRQTPKEYLYCAINVKTGELIVPPLLEIVTPEWYVNDPNIFKS